MGISIKRSVCVDSLNKIGIFSGSLLVAASAVYFYSPIFKSNAATDFSKVQAEINSVLSLSLDSNHLTISVVPTDSGTFNSGSLTATTNTNNATGYELYFSAEDNTTDMIHSDSSVSNVIHPTLMAL